MFDVNQLFSQKWSPKFSKPNFWSKTVGTIFAVFVLHLTSFLINLIISVWCQSIIFSEMRPGALKSILLFEDSGHSICCCFLLPTSFPINLIIIVWYHSTIFSDMSQKVSKANFCSKTMSTIFALFAFHSTSFPIIWLLLFDVNQLFSQKWRLKLLKADFCSKTVGTIFAVFVLHSTSFQINLIINVWCQTIIFSEMRPEGLKSKLLLEDSGHSICCFCSSFNIFSNQLDR